MKFTERVEYKMLDMLYLQGVRYYLSHEELILSARFLSYLPTIRTSHNTALMGVSVLICKVLNCLICEEKKKVKKT